VSLPGLIKRIVSSMLVQMGQPRFGIVTSVDPNTYTAQVNIQPDNTPSGWLPIKSEWIGNGWGLVAVPNVGDQVTLLPHDGDANNLVISGRVYSQGQQPPVGVPGEFWLVNVSGAFIKLVTSGAIQITAPAGLTIDANVTVTGALTATGNVTAGQGTSGQVDLLGHKHTSESPGTPTSAPIAGS
jgi:phage baseplate assembly protein gpV